MHTKKDNLYRASYSSKILYCYLAVLITINAFFVTLSSAEEQKDLNKLAEIVEQMGPGEWHELSTGSIPLISNKQLAAIQEKYGGSDLRGWGGQNSVITAWNSAAYDPKGHEWYFFGGGHANYGGNEVYAFDFKDLHWTRLTDPSPLTGPSYVDKKRNCPVPKEGPPAPHTYDGFEWNPDTQTVWLLGLTVPFCTQGYGKAPEKFWEFNPKTRTWESHNAKMLLTHPVSAYNPISKRFVVLNTQGGLAGMEVDQHGNVYKYRKLGSWAVDGTGSYDPLTNTLYFLTSASIQKVLLNEKELKVEKASSFRQKIKDFGARQAGFAFHPSQKKWMFWFGKRETVSWDPLTDEFQLYNNASSPSAPDGTSRIYGKWIYIPEVDVFAGYNNPKSGVWLYKPAWNTGDPVVDEIRACVNENCKYRTISAALKAAPDGSKITIKPGEWRDGGIVKADNVTIEGDPGARLYDKAFEGKAALVVKGNNTTITNIECSGIQVSGENGSCVRLEGKNLTLKNVYFHENQMGMLTGPGTGHVLIEDSVFEQNGIKGGALGHNLYIQSDKVSFLRSKSMQARNEGHEFKSRASETIIKDSVIASMDSTDSRLIDVPNGGEIRIENCWLYQGPNSSNQDAIGIGLERGKNYGTDHKYNSFKLINNIILLERKGSNILVNEKGFEKIKITGNKIIGGLPYKNNDNVWYPDRSSAGLSKTPF